MNEQENNLYRKLNFDMLVAFVAVFVGQLAGGFCVRDQAIEFCYSSIFDDCWIVKRDTLGIHRYPTKFYDIPDSVKFFN